MLKTAFITFFFALITACSQQSALSIPHSAPLDNYNLKNTRSFLLTPEGNGPFPTVILMHGCGGLSYEVKIALEDHAQFLQKQGYASLIIDSFSSRGELGKDVCSSFDKLAAARDYRQIDAYNALIYLQSQPHIDQHNIFLMGQSNGGSVALKLADKQQYVGSPLHLTFNAIVAFYPWCGVRPEKLDTPLLILGGEKDDWTPISPCLMAEKKTMEQAFNVIQFPNAHHSFDLFVPVQHYQGHTVGGNAYAQKESQKQMLAWFEKFKVNMNQEGNDE